MSIFHTQNHYFDIIAYYALNLTEFHMHFHSHPQCEIMYVVSGSCRVVTTDEAHTLHKHQFIFLDGSLPHRLQIDGPEPCSILNLEFLCSSENGSISIDELKKESPDFSDFLLEKQTSFMGNDTESLGYAMKDLIARLQQKDGDTSYHYLKKLLFYRVLLELSMCYRKNKQSGSIIHLRKACDYIHAHLTEELRIPDISAHVGINKSYLHALFNKYMHCTISDYINQCRLAQAAFLLSNSSLTVTDIAFQSGYNSRQHFSVTFEKYYEMTPRSYRQLHQKKLETSTGNSQLVLRENGTWMPEPLSP